MTTKVGEMADRAISGFDLMDRDSDGILSPLEIEYLRTMGPPDGADATLAKQLTSNFTAIRKMDTGDVYWPDGCVKGNSFGITYEDLQMISYVDKGDRASFRSDARLPGGYIAGSIFAGVGAGIAAAFGTAMFTNLSGWRSAAVIGLSGLAASALTYGLGKSYNTNKQENYYMQRKELLGNIDIR